MNDDGWAELAYVAAILVVIIGAICAVALAG
jgi:hypothetical protein